MGIGTSVQTRDFGQTANVKTREILRVDKAVGNHADCVSIGTLVKPESRDKRFLLLYYFCLQISESSMMIFQFEIFSNIL